MLQTIFITKVQDCQVTEEKKIFELIDKNKDGVLSVDELKQGFKINNKEIDHLFYGLDADQNGKIQYTEWLAAAKDWSQGVTDQQIKEAFRIFDLNSDGFIEWDELKEVLESYQQIDDLTDKIWKEMISEVDSDGDGKVTLQDFQKLFPKTS